MKFTVQAKRPRTLSKATQQSYWSSVRPCRHVNARALLIEIDDEFYVSIVGLLPYSHLVLLRSSISI